MRSLAWALTTCCAIASACGGHEVTTTNVAASFPFVPGDFAASATSDDTTITIVNAIGDSACNVVRSTTSVPVANFLEIVITLPTEAVSASGTYMFADGDGSATYRMTDETCNITHAGVATSGTITIERTSTSISGSAKLYFDEGIVIVNFDAPTCGDLVPPTTDTCTQLATCDVDAALCSDFP